MLVGRAAELDLFRALLRDLVAGRGRALLVELRRTVTVQGATLLRLRELPAGPVCWRNGATGSRSGIR